MADLLQYWTVRLGILAVTGTLLAFGIMGTLQIPVEFDAVLLLPADSYLRSGLQAQSVTVTPLGQGESVTVSNCHCKQR